MFAGSPNGRQLGLPGGVGELGDAGAGAGAAVEPRKPEGQDKHE